VYRNNFQLGQLLTNRRCFQKKSIDDGSFIVKGIPTILKKKPPLFVLAASSGDIGHTLDISKGEFFGNSRSIVAGCSALFINVVCNNI
jgi:hypothetical protein